jgi:hypothetical protein
VKKGAITGAMLLLVISSFFVSIEMPNIKAESPQSQTDWKKTYGGPDGEIGWSVIETGDGGFALAGYTYSYGDGGYDFWLVKTDSAGNVQWNQTYGGSGREYAVSVIETGDGGFALVGHTYSYGNGGYDAWVVRTAENGNELWNQTYGGANSDFAVSIVETGEGDFALAGLSNSYGTGDYALWVVRTAENGNELWNRIYGGARTEDGWSVIETGDGGFALAGYTYSYGDGGYDFWLVKTDSAGNVQWNQTYGGANSDYGMSGIATSDGGYAIVGYTDSFGAGNGDFWLVKTDANGNELWNQTYGGVEADECYSVVETGDGGFALAGYTYSYGAGSSDFWLVKTSNSPNEEFLFNVTVDEVDYAVGTCSNSSVSDLSLNADLKRLRLFVEGPSGTTGFCNVTVPEELMWGVFTLYLDDEVLVESVDYTKSYNGTHYVFSVTYVHSIHIIELFSTDIVPDFTGWLFLPVLISATLLGFALRKKLKKQKPT